MFNLDQEVDHWKSAFAKTAACSSDELLELESHLREEIAALVAAGRSEQEAFCESVARLGDPTNIGGEFEKNQEEITFMPESEFGKPEVAGKRISNGKGRIYLKKLKRALPIAVAVCLVLVISIRWAIAEPFYVPGRGAEPSIPQGSRVLVYKLASVFRAGDVVAFRDAGGEILLAIVKTDQGGVLTASRNGEADHEVPHARVIGRVVANTR